MQDNSKTVFCISYDDVIRSRNIGIVKTIMANDNLKSHYAPYLDLEKFEGLDDPNLIRECIFRRYFNIFKSMSKNPITDTEADEAFNTFMTSYRMSIMESPILAIGDALHIILAQRGTEKVYIHTETYDPVVHEDILVTYERNEKISYVTGDIGAFAADNKDIGTYMIADYRYGRKIAEAGNLEGGSIIMARYVYNLDFIAPLPNSQPGDIGTTKIRGDWMELTKKYKFQFAAFSPYKLKEENFTMLNK